jgi:HK97 family phage major capsid protein
VSDIAKRLRERRNNVWEQAKALADTATEENRAFSAEEQGTWDALNEELNNLDTRIKSVLDGEKRAKDADSAMERIAGKPVENRTGGADGNVEKDLDAQFRALGNGERRSVDVALPSAYERRALLAPMEQRAAILTTNAPLPTTFIGQLYQYLVDTSSIRQANPRVYTTQSGENLTIPRSTAEGSATWTSEGAALTESNPTLSSVTLSAYKVGKLIYVSRELLDDTGFDLLGFVAEHAGRNIGIAVDSAYVGGSGTGQPTGFVGAATTAKTGATGQTTTVTTADLLDLYHSVIPQYRPRASWVMHDSTIKQIRKLADSTGQLLWQSGLQVGQPDMLFGRPVYADPNMPVMAANAKSIAFGDFGGYWIRDVTPLRFDRSDDFKFDTDVVSFRVLYRTDGKLGDTNAVKLYVNSAT